MSDRVSIPNAWPLMGYAPGKYMGKCRVCGDESYDLDKRAWNCLECAARRAKETIVALNVENAQLRKIIEGFASRVETQAGCLEKYAEMAGFEAKPIPSVFHFQASHFRDFAKDARAAQGIEAGTAETAGLGPKDESPVANGDAPKPSPEVSND